jgi:integrase
LPPRVTKYNASRDYGTRSAELDRFKVRFGRHAATIYRRKDSGASTWHFRIYLKDEHVHYRKSLRTTDKRDAVQFAEQEIVNILAKQQNGQKIRSQTFAEAVRAFQLADEGELAAGIISKRTVIMHNYYIGTVSEYIKEKFKAGIRTRLSEIDGRRDFADYLEWRMKRGSIRRDSVQAELVGVRLVLRFAKDNGLCDEKSLPKWDFKTEPTPRRRRMNDDDYPKVLACMQTWIKKAKGDVDTYNRQLLRHIFLLISATGMRTGEVLRLKNKDVEFIAREKLEAVIRIRAETTKVRQERRITVSASLGGRITNPSPINYLIRWIDEYQIHKNPDDFAFSLYTKGTGQATFEFYRSYGALREDLEEIGLDWWDVYHNRHHFCTEAIRAGHPLALIAAACGNSVTVIEKTYSHILSEITTREMAKKRVVRFKDGGYEVVSRNGHSKDQEEG